MSLLRAYRGLPAADRLFRDHLPFAERVRTHLLIHRLLALKAVREPRGRRMPLSAVNGLRRSGTVFVFGSGRSLLDLSDADWDVIRRHDSVGFTGFFQQRWIDLDFHLLRGWVDVPAAGSMWLDVARDFIGKYEANPQRLARTRLVLQEDYTATFCHSLFALGFVARHAHAGFFGYTTNPRSDIPSLRPGDGLAHSTGTLCDAVNFALVGGWKTVILAGVDLYESGYFFHREGETERWDPAARRMVVSPVTTRGVGVHQPHNTVTNGIVERIAEWAEYAKMHAGAEIRVLNPRSLLAARLPVHTLRP